MVRKPDIDLHSPVESRLPSSDDSRPTSEENMKSISCLFCDGQDGILHQATSSNIDSSWKTMATELRDSNILRKLSMGDIVAVDGAYHNARYTSFYTKHRALTRKSTSHQPLLGLERDAEACALEKVVAYIEECKETVEDTSPVFKLKHLNKCYIISIW